MNETLAGKRFARTTITNKDGTITPARINLETGEIKPYPYKDAQNSYIKPKPKNPPKSIDYSLDGDLLGYTPHWIISPPPDNQFKVRGDKTVRKNKTNDNNIFLKDYYHLDHANEELPILDNLIEGVSLLNCGNNKPLNKGLLFSMLRDLDNINSKAIQAYTGYSEAYSSRLAQYLIVLSNAFDMEVGG